MQGTSSNHEVPLFFEVYMIETHRILLNWYAKEARSFPWRYLNPEPYHVLISEYMLQQTQTQRIAERFPVFIEQFPNIHALSNTTKQEIIMAWQGLGYNNRALRLRDCAIAIVDKHEGIIPDTYDELTSLPGIGPYTASAIMAFAYGIDIAIIDVNIHRIYSRILGISDPADANKRMIMSFAEHAYPKGKASEWHQALMDIGATLCKANHAICNECPLHLHCKSAFQVQMQVKKKSRKEPSHRDVPNRIWRGKTIECLRNRPSYAESKELLLDAIIEDHINTQDIHWFDHIILPSLVKDSLIEYDMQTHIVSIAS